MGLTVEIEGLTKLLADAERAGASAQRLVGAAIKASVDHIQEEARHRAPHAFGTLQQHILTQIDYPVGQVSSGEKYSIDVEKGTKPHEVPYKAIERWAKKKGIPSNKVGAIVDSIKRKGTKPHPFFQPAIEASATYINDQFVKVIERLTNELAGKGSL